jgi:hypothetical protein
MENNSTISPRLDEAAPEGVLFLAFKQVAFDGRTLLKKTLARTFVESHKELFQKMHVFEAGIVPVISKAGRPIFSRRAGSPVRGQALHHERLMMVLGGLDEEKVGMLIDALNASGFLIMDAMMGTPFTSGPVDGICAVAKAKSNVALTL